MANFNLNRRQFVGGALATSALAALAGCSGNNAGKGSAPAADAPKVDTANVIRFYLSEPAFIDPYNGQENQGNSVICNMFDGLYDWDYTNNVATPLAAADMPTISEDGLVYTIKLREGMKFHNGDAVDAESFKRGWQRCADPKMETPGEIGYHLAPIAGYAEYAAGDAEEITGIKVVDDLTLEVTLTAPMGDFLAVLTHPSLAPVPQAALDDPKSFLEAPIGNGPFMIDGKWEHNQYINCVRFDDYYGEKPAIEGVYFSIQATPDTAFNEFEAGNLDFAAIPVGRVKECIEKYGQSEDGYTSTPGKQTLTGTELSVYFLIPGPQCEILQNPAVRQAVSLAINRQNIVDTLYEGMREPATSIMPKAIDADEKNTWEYCAYDPEKAKQVLADAGLDPADITFELNYNSDGDHGDIMTAVQADLEAIGIKTTQASVEWATYLTQLSSGEFGLGRLGWTADYPTMDNFLYPNFFSTADNNYEEYNKPEIDAAILEARSIQDDEERKAACREICAKIGEDMPVIPIMFYAHNYIGGDRCELTYDATTKPVLRDAKMV